MINIIVFILFAPLIWFFGWYLHELFHKLAAKVQGVDSYIQIWYNHGIPSMRCIPKQTLPHPGLFDIAGGLGAGLSLLLLSYLGYSYWPLFIPFFVVGSINFIYGFYEVTFLRRWSINKYMKYHYLLYLIVGIMSLIIAIHGVY